MVRQRRARTQRPLTLASAPVASRVTTGPEGRHLAERLRDPTRVRPVVVLTAKGGHDAPFVDARHIYNELGPDVVDVVEVTTREATTALSANLPDHASVYGGAARVYPVDITWLDDPAAPQPWIAFGYSPDEAPGQTATVLAEARKAAIAAGLLAPTPTVVYSTSTAAADEDAPLTDPTPDAAESALQLAAELHNAHRQIEDLRTRLSASEQDRQTLTKTLRAAEACATSTADVPAFTNPVEQFEWEVYREWVERIPAAQKPDLPLTPYSLGAGFLDSIEAVHGISRAKTVAVVVEILTGLAANIPGRGVHPLRDGEGGDNPQHVRADGAAAWRVSLQTNTPAARRLHYWRLLDGTIELSKVTTHNDTAP